MRPTAKALFVFLCLFSTRTLPEEGMSPEQIKQNLKELAAEISAYRERLESTEAQKTAEEANLESIEKEISELVKQVEAKKEDLRQGRARSSDLREQEKELKATMTRQHRYIEQQIRAAHKTGGQGYLKMLLNQEDPHDVFRMLTYYKYFHEARTQLIRNYEETLEELEGVTRALTSENRALVEDGNILVARQRALARAREEKKGSLEALNLEIATAGTRIRTLGRDRARLEALLERIGSSVAKLLPEDVAKPFEGMRGNLLMPVFGEVAHRFGQSRSGGKLRWNGVFIAAPEGEAVHAVHYGRVIFSDWLRGLGLVIIISHGDGYMSVYGHNQVLYRQAGDWVTAGDIIAAVGDTGGQSESGLYFEIRVRGKPTDPQKWCKARQQGTV